MSGHLLDASTVIAAEDAGDRFHDAARRMVSSAAALHSLDLAFLETANVAVRRWNDAQAAARLRWVIAELERSGRLVRTDERLVAAATEIASEHDISAYDAAYVAAARAVDATLVSCDVRDLVSKGLAVTPADA